MKKQEEKENNEKIVMVPLRNIPQLTDERWQQLAYQNWLERSAS